MQASPISFDLKEIGDVCTQAKENSAFSIQNKWKLRCSSKNNLSMLVFAASAKVTLSSETIVKQLVSLFYFMKFSRPFNFSIFAKFRCSKKQCREHKMTRKLGDFHDANYEKITFLIKARNMRKFHVIR